VTLKLAVSTSQPPVLYGADLFLLLSVFASVQWIKLAIHQLFNAG